MAFLNSAAVDSPFDMLWITVEWDNDGNGAIFDTLANWVPMVRDKGKRVALYGVKHSLWRSHSQSHSRSNSFHALTHFVSAFGFGRLYS